MKIEVLQESLTKALTLASRFVSPRAQLPVLGNILLSAKKNKLQISSTNLEVSVSSSVVAKVEREGEITVPGRTITDLISNLNSQSVKLEAEKEHLKISTPNFESDISGMNASDFPAIPQLIAKETGVPLKKDLFLEGLSQVLYAASIDETRPVLTGVLFIFQQDVLVLVATDGFRLSQKKVSIKAKALQKLILPKSILFELSRFNEAEEIVLAFNQKENQVLFATDDTVFSSRLLEGEFPDYERIIPKSTLAKVFLDKEELLRAVKLAGVFARESANIIKLNLGKDYVDILAESAASGNQTTRIDAKVEGEEKMEVAFNYRFLEEFLHSVKGEEVKLELSGPSSPGVFTDPKDPTFLHLIMPVRIQG
ncbi:MAG: DNA polymerase III subunit beta [Patescibacteria group bacterium]